MNKLFLINMSFIKSFDELILRVCLLVNNIYLS